MLLHIMHAEMMHVRSLSLLVSFVFFFSFKKQPAPKHQR